VPTLIIQGDLDTVVDPAGASWLHQHLGSTQKSLVRFPQSDHLVTLDRERNQVIERIKEFLQDP
jgi:carboxylesterase